MQFRPFLIAVMLCSLLIVGVGQLAAHCQIPCGIYDDELRVQLVEEHIGTIEKSMKSIIELAAAETPDSNQIVRWVMNKEEHATKIQDIVTDYFMAQRIKKPADTDAELVKTYQTQLSLLHQIQVAAMKSKQGTDQAYVQQMRELVSAFRKAYFGEEKTHTH